MTATEAQVRECARRAAQMINRFGWAQGEAVESDEDNPPHCLVTATERATWDAEDDDNDRAIPPGGTDEIVNQRAATVLGLRPPGASDAGSAVVAWNDAPSRTVAEVIAVLERVAAGEGAP